MRKFMLLVVGMLALGLAGCGEKMTDEDRVKAMEQCAATLTEKAAAIKAKGAGAEESFEACGTTLAIGTTDGTTAYFKSEYGGSNGATVTIGGKEVMCVLGAFDDVECKVKE